MLTRAAPACKQRGGRYCAREQRGEGTARLRARTHAQLQPTPAGSMEQQRGARQRNRGEGTGAAAQRRCDGGAAAQGRAAGEESGNFAAKRTLSRPIKLAPSSSV